MTVHGDHFRESLDRGERARYDRGDVVVRHPRLAGRNTCAVFHPDAAVRRLLGAFDTVEHHPSPMTHELYVAR